MAQGTAGPTVSDTRVGGGGGGTPNPLAPPQLFFYTFDEIQQRSAERAAANQQYGKQTPDFEPLVSAALGDSFVAIGDGYGVSLSDEQIAAREAFDAQVLSSYGSGSGSGSGNPYSNAGEYDPYSSSQEEVPQFGPVVSAAGESNYIAVPAPGGN